MRDIGCLPGGDVPDCGGSFGEASECGDERKAAMCRGQGVFYQLPENQKVDFASMGFGDRITL